MGDYFWLLCGAWCGLLGAGYMRFQLRKKIIAGDFSKEEVTSFTRAYALWVAGPCTLLWVLQQSLGEHASPMFLLWPHPQKSVALALQFIVWGALLWWIFLREGAATLSRYLRATQGVVSFFNGPGAVRAGAVLVVVGGLFAVFGSSGI